jgi:hypothetical protein
MAFVNNLGRASPIARRPDVTFSMSAIRTGEDAGYLDGRSGSYSGIGYPMMTVRRRAASLWPRT